MDPLQQALMNDLSPGSVPPMNQLPPPEEAFDLQKFIEELNKVPVPSYGDVLDNYQHILQTPDYSYEVGRDRNNYIPIPPAARPSVYDVLGIPLNVGGNV